MIKFSSLSLLTVALVAGSTWAAPFDDLLTKVPAGANTLVLIDVTTTLAPDQAKAKP